MDEEFEFKEPLDKEQKEMLRVWSATFNSQFILRTDHEKQVIVNRAKQKILNKK